MDKNKLRNKAKVAAKRSKSVKPANQKKNVVFRLDPEIIDELDQYSKKHGLTKVSIIEELLKQFLKK
jgi:hypothetical protein